MIVKELPDVKFEEVWLYEDNLSSQVFTVASISGELERNPRYCFEETPYNLPEDYLEPYTGHEEECAMNTIIKEIVDTKSIYDGLKIQERQLQQDIEDCVEQYDQLLCNLQERVGKGFKIGSSLQTNY